jgi:hypothetical protein
MAGIAVESWMSRFGTVAADIDRLRRGLASL